MAHHRGPWPITAGVKPHDRSLHAPSSARGRIEPHHRKNRFGKFLARRTSSNLGGPPIRHHPAFVITTVDRPRQPADKIHRLANRPRRCKSSTATPRRLAAAHLILRHNSSSNPRKTLQAGLGRIYFW